MAIRKQDKKRKTAVRSVAVDKGGPNGDYTARVHGVRDSEGNTTITRIERRKPRINKKMSESQRVS